MHSEFLIVIITSPDRIDNEADKIAKLLDAGVDYVHIRKPDWNLREVKDLIEDIPYKYRRRLRLHGHFELLNEMNLAGAHLNRRNPEPPANALSLTCSCHSAEELTDSAKYSYVTLSPIFDSISKSGYKQGFEIEKLSSELTGRRVIALGGVTADKLLMLRDKGFYGAALLGYIWNGDFEKSLTVLRHNMEMLRKQYHR